MRGFYRNHPIAHVALTQLLLDLRPTQPPSFDNFIVGDNAELVARLRLLAEPSCYDSLTLWGASGCGKSHLLAATAVLAQRKRPVLLLSGCRSASADFVLPDAGRQDDPEAARADIHAPAGGLLIVDDVDRLDTEAQIGLFRVFNTARLIGLGILLASRQPPAKLGLREDLRTRIAQTLVYHVKTLTDEEKAAALRRHALERGLKVDDSLVRYLLSHGRRDLPSLMAVLDHLDRTTLERKQQATLPLLKEVMQLPLVPDDNESRPV